MPDLSFLWDQTNGRLSTSLGEKNLSNPEIFYQQHPSWQVSFKTNASGVLSALDVSAATTWAAAIDTTYANTGDPCCRTLNANIDSSGAASGNIVVSLDANTSTFLAALASAQNGVITGWFELRGLNVSAEMVYYAFFPIYLRNTLDPSGGTPPDPEGDYYNKTEADALLSGKAGAPATTTENYVPQWSATQKLLKDGLGIGTGANMLVQLDGSSKLPAVDGSQLTNLPGGASAFTDLSDVPSSYSGQGGKYVKVNSGATALEFDTPAGGGDVLGPATNTDNAIPRFDGADSKTIQNSLVTIDDSGSINIPSGQSYKKNGTALAYGDVGAAAASHNHTLSAITDAGTAAAGTTGTGNGNIPTRPADNALSADTISEITGSAGVTIDGVKALDSFLELTEVAAPAAGAANTMRVYAKDDSGTTKLCVKDSAGTETILGAGGGGGTIDNTSRGDGTAWTSTTKGISAAKLEEALNEVGVRPADRASLLESADSGLLVKAYYDSVDSFDNADIDAFSTYLKAIWNLTETSGNRADSVGSNTLVDNGSAGYTESGISGNAADLNGTSQFFSLADNADVSPTTGFLFSLWVNPDAWNSATSRFLFEKENAAQDERDYALAWWNDRAAGKLTFMLQQSNGTNCEFDMAGAVSTGSWQHLLVAAYDGTMKIYVNGVADSNTQSYNNTIRDSAHTFYIGCRTGNSHYFDGKIARMGFWKNPSGSWTAITNAAVALYNDGAGVFYDTNITQDFRLSSVKDSALITTAADQFDSLSEKTSLAANDMFLIEDSADGSAKKYVKKSNLGAMTYPGAGVAISTGSAWGSSLTAPSGDLVGTSDSQALTNKSVNGVTPTAESTGFTLAGGTTSKTLTVTADATISGTPALSAGAADIEITDATKGLILKSADGTRFRITVDNSGALNINSL